MNYLVHEKIVASVKKNIKEHLICEKKNWENIMIYI